MDIGNVEEREMIKDGKNTLHKSPGTGGRRKEV